MNTLVVSSSLFSSEPEGDLTYCNGQPGSAFASWLKSGMLDLGWDCGELIQEDYGWGFWINSDKDTIWISVSYAQAETEGEQGEWYVAAKHEIPFLMFQPWRWANKTGKTCENKIFGQLKELITANSSIL
ncbi:MAG: hypothetical protein K2X27_10635, partial [Candidatus Obscuribacterales bacterium]|nr:hypothetical protein [Candidatus Obscuribacterales bacterium]